jgi:hypothetical protein
MIRNARSSGAGRLRSDPTVAFALVHGRGLPSTDPVAAAVGFGFG